MNTEIFEHEQNIPASADSHKNVPEYLEYTQNIVRIFKIKMQFDCQRIYNEFSFSFRRQSNSLWQACEWATRGATATGCWLRPS